MLPAISADALQGIMSQANAPIAVARRSDMLKLFFMVVTML